MALNPASQSPSAPDVIDGTVTEFYNVMDECIRRSEVMPGQYKSITSPSYSNNCPINGNSFTTIDVGCPAPQTVDIDNSFITADFDVDITFPAGIQSYNDVNTFFVGWRSSLDVLSRYIIYCNHKVVYDQPYVGEESFILQSLIPEHVRCRKPNQYTTYDNASTYSPNVCGTYIKINSTAGGEDNPTALANAVTVRVTIPVKIDINQFLMFTNFKYLPGFCGTWSIKLFPSVQNMIICPVDPKFTVPPNKLYLLSMLDSTTVGAGNSIDSYTHHFVQMGDKFQCLKVVKFKAPTFTSTSASTSTPTYVTEGTASSGTASIATTTTTTTTTTYNSAITPGKIQVTADNLSLKNVLYHQTQFELMYDVYDALKARYIQRPLTIPVNKLDFGRFAGNMSSTQSSSTYTAAVSNVESIFVLPFTDDFHHTICFNPEFTGFYLSISGFGNYPPQPFDTAGDGEAHNRFMNMTLDALNINNSAIMAPNKDLMNSLQKKQVRYWNNAAAGVTTETNDDKHDCSNFLIGFPFSNDVDFQGGLTSNGNINIKLTHSTSQINELNGKLRGAIDSDAAVACGIGATVMFVSDAALMIKVIPYSDAPECRLVTERIV